MPAQSLLLKAIQNIWQDGGLDIDCSHKYAEPGYSTPTHGILFADWNEKRNPDGTYSDTTLSRVAKLVDRTKLPISLEWSDEWTTCHDCNRAIRTQADSYSWLPSYVLMNDCEIVCHDCLDPTEYADHLMNDPDRADTLGIDWSEHGWTMVDETHQNGWYGREDSPAEIAKRVPEDHDYLFQITGSGQFAMEFVLWTRAQE